MDQDLFKRIVTFVKPFVENQQSRPHLVGLALRDSPALDHINWSGAAHPFASHLADTVRIWGDADDLCRLVRGLAESAGSEQQGTAETLCRDLQRDHKPADVGPGTPLDGRYTLVHELGQGGNGTVWKAQWRMPDSQTVTDVAIKVLNHDIIRDPQRIARFKQEISVACKLKHPHIIRTLYWGEHGDQFYAVMDYVEGQTLRDFIAGRQFSEAATVRYLAQVAEALDFAHQQGIVHRDVKPENILVRRDNLYLGDFGLAISPDEDMRLSRSGELVGTKKYMAPEQWDGQPGSPQTDIYALGIMAYEMLTGVYPYDDSSHGQLAIHHLQHELPPHDSLPAEVLRLLRRATAKDPAARFASATEFITELAHWKLNEHALETKVQKYLDLLRVRIRGAFYEQFFVDLEGDIRELLPPPESVAAVDEYDDPYLSGLVETFGIDLDADHHAPPTADDARDPEYVPNILDRLAHSERVVLVGEPGAGKTFTLRRLVMRYINRYDEHRRVPVFVPLNAFRGETTFEAYIKAQMGDLAGYYARLRDDGRLVLLCDALNEMRRAGPDPDRRDLLAEVRSALAHAPLFVVSCRVRDYDRDLDDLQLERLEVRDMELPAIKDFIEKYLRDAGPAFWERIGGSEDLFTFWGEVRGKGEPERFWQQDGGIPSYTSVSGDRAWRAMWRGAKLIPLARKPYLARVICALHKQQALPDNRAALYAAFVDELYASEAKHAAGAGQPFPVRERLDAFLVGLADRLQAEKATVLQRAGLNLDADLLQAALDATLLTLDGDDLRFTHQLLQEYYAVQTLSEKLYADEDPRPLFGADWWRVAAWRETAAMLVEFTGEAGRVARWLGRANPDFALETLGRFQSDAPSDATRDALIASALAKTSEPNPQGRAAAYRVLARFNADPGDGIGTIIRDGVTLPDIDWVTIPDDGPWTYQDAEHPGLPAFAISRYPVTYAQFQAFIDDPAGFHDARWWDGLALPAGHNNAPGDQAFKYWSHPRERVSWYDALAFCRWLSWRLGGGWDLDAVEEWAVRLPTEMEWEKAARGTDGRKYPYAGDFDPAKGNTSATGIRQTSAVGIFPDGASPYGVLDLSGNVWEWCLTDYHEPAPDASGEDLRTDARRVLRGGSWDDYRGYARAVSRINYGPSYRYGHYGFRVVVRPPSQKLSEAQP